MSSWDEVLSILAKSENVLELPTAISPPAPTDWMIFHNVTAQRIEKIHASQIVGASPWLWVENSFIVKDVGNTDKTLLEANDVVYFKPITNSGDPLTLVGQTYDGGDKQERTSYTQNQVIDI